MQKQASFTSCALIMFAAEGTYPAELRPQIEQATRRTLAYTFAVNLLLNSEELRKAYDLILSLTNSA